MPHCKSFWASKCSVVFSHKRAFQNPGFELKANTAVGLFHLRDGLGGSLQVCEPLAMTLLQHACGGKFQVQDLSGTQHASLGRCSGIGNGLMFRVRKPDRSKGSGYVMKLGYRYNQQKWQLNRSK